MADLTLLDSVVSLLLARLLACRGREGHGQDFPDGAGFQEARVSGPWVMAQMQMHMHDAAGDTSRLPRICIKLSSVKNHEWHQAHD